MKKYELNRATAIAVIIGVTAIAPAALGGEGDRAWRDAERARAFTDLIDRLLHDTELRRADIAASTSPLSVDFSGAVSLGALQEDAEDSGVLEATYTYQESIDYDHDGDVDEGDLARAAQNPIADLISLPLQNNLNIDFGELNYEQYVLNIQPVIPFNLNEDLNLITRTILPVIYQPAIFSGDEHTFGIGDIQFTPFFVPTREFGGWMIGGGPVFRIPSATDERLGARKWAVGPSAVAILIEGPWLIGSLFQQVWSIAGSGDQNVSEFLWQPFINYNIPDSGGWYLTSAPIITANWMADSDDQWTVPVGGGFGRVFRIGDQPINCSLQGFYNVEKPDVAGDWTIRFQFQLLFPR